MRSRIEPVKKFVRTVRAHRELLLNYFRAKKQFSSGVIEGLNSQSHTEKSVRLSDVQDRRTLSVSRARQASRAKTRPQILLTNQISYPHVFGSFARAREALRRMSTRHGGRGGAIVNVSSVAARLGAPGQYVDYAAAKGAVDTFTLGLAREVANEGVRVNAVRPGIILTNIHASGGEPDRAARLAPAVPMRRAGSAAEVAAAIIWLLSDEASYTTGAIVDVGGGR